MRRLAVSLLLLVVAGPGCVRVGPHERQRLAHPAMQSPAWPAVEQGDQHTFAIREGTGGASAAGGGGCGCN